MRTTTLILLCAAWYSSVAQPGNVDTTFHSHLLPDNGSIANVIALPNSMILVGGSFVAYDGVTCGRIARLNANGTLDATFPAGTGFDGSVLCMELQPDGRVLVGGTFGSYDGAPCPRLARLNADGTLDTSFQPVIEDLQGVAHLVVLPDGRILVGGYHNTAPFVGLQRLMPDGTLDSGFNAPAGIRPNAIAVLADQRIVLGRNDPTPPFDLLIRLSPNGELDPSFTPAAFDGIGLAAPVIQVIHEQAGGTLLIGGHFGGCDGAARKGLLRLSVDGALDPAYDPADANWTNDAMWWSSVHTMLPGITEGLIIPKFGYVQQFLADGSIDNGFHGATGIVLGDGRLANIADAARQADGKILLAGAFESVDGVAGLDLVRLNDCVLGAACDDGDGNTANDVVDSVCTCAGVLITGIEFNGSPNMLSLHGPDATGAFTLSGTMANEEGMADLTVYDVLGRPLTVQKVSLHKGPVRIVLEPAAVHQASGVALVALRARSFNWVQRVHW